MSTDFDASAQFPPEILATPLRPDIVLWSVMSRVVLQLPLVCKTLCEKRSGGWLLAFYFTFSYKACFKRLSCCFYERCWPSVVKVLNKCGKTDFNVLQHRVMAPSVS